MQHSTRLAPRLEDAWMKSVTERAAQFQWKIALELFEKLFRSEPERIPRAKVGIIGEK